MIAFIQNAVTLHEAAVEAIEKEAVYLILTDLAACTETTQF